MHDGKEKDFLSFCFNKRKEIMMHDSSKRKLFFFFFYLKWKMWNVFFLPFLFLAGGLFEAFEV